MNMFGLEYAHIASHLAGEVSREGMFEELFAAIRHLAKRQETWFRGMERRGFVVHRDPRARILTGQGRWFWGMREAGERS